MKRFYLVLPVYSVEAANKVKKIKFNTTYRKSSDSQKAIQATWGTLKDYSIITSMYPQT